MEAEGCGEALGAWSAWMDLVGVHVQGPSDLSSRVRESALDAVTTDDAHADAAGTNAPAASASALRAMLPAVRERLTPGETLLLDELLTKLSRQPHEG